MGGVSAILLIIVTILFPPAGVWAVGGCGPDFLINCCLTLLGYLPGHIHAFYLIYVYYERKEATLAGVIPQGDAPGVYSHRINTGGVRGYGTLHEQRAQEHTQGQA
ncbi:hypothetical protein DRE_06298 [Drechslerella stenobrocha 248]|uniref:Plasma membrane proteolipid 3 n=1 Tax=Drechslerella stenobrocha 248 TaxID=1043628 RepID=W7HYJ5_9PEZI|nr:hypothetical protein DRE_06298 [Drechslerella stenobrocha 248]